MEFQRTCHTRCHGEVDTCISLISHFRIENPSLLGFVVGIIANFAVWPPLIAAPNGPQLRKPHCHCEQLNLSNCTTMHWHPSTVVTWAPRASKRWHILLSVCFLFGNGCFDVYIIKHEYGIMCLFVVDISIIKGTKRRQTQSASKYVSKSSEWTVVSRAFDTPWTHQSCHSAAFTKVALSSI